MAIGHEIPVLDMKETIHLIHYTECLSNAGMIGLTIDTTMLLRDSTSTENMHLMLGMDIIIWKETDITEKGNMLKIGVIGMNEIIESAKITLILVSGHLMIIITTMIMNNFYYHLFIRGRMRIKEHKVIVTTVHSHLHLEK
jgi:hypothetical protein